MMARHRGDIVGEELCLILGEKSDKVHSVTIKAEAGNVAVVWIERYLETDEIDEIKTVLSKYSLVALESVPLE